VPTNQRPEENHDDVQIGDSAEVVSGPHRGFIGMVEMVSSGMASLRAAAAFIPVVLASSCITVPVTSANFLPPSNALKYSAEKGYNVRSEDAVEVVQGHWIGRRGIVREIDLQKKMLAVNAWANSICISPLLPPAHLPVYQDCFFVPITHVVHESVVFEFDQNRQYVGKEVIIIKGHYKGWRGTFRSILRDTCEVTPGNAPISIFKKRDVAVR